MKNLFFTLLLFILGLISANAADFPTFFVKNDNYYGNFELRYAITTDNKSYALFFTDNAKFHCYIYPNYQLMQDGKIYGTCTSNFNKWRGSYYDNLYKKDKHFYINIQTQDYIWTENETGDFNKIMKIVNQENGNRKDIWKTKSKIFEFKN